MIIAIFAPTGSGKSEVAISIAKKYNGVIINMDSFQIYKDMNIATAKPTQADFLKCEHLLYNIISPNKEFSVFDYKNIALKTIEDVKKENKLPILVGGTGLYLSSLYYDFKFRNINDLNLNSYSLKELQGILFVNNKEIYKQIDIANRHRLINAIKTNKVYKKEEKIKSNLDIKIISFEIERDILYEKINKRVDRMFDLGIKDEFNFLIKKYNLNEQSKSLKAIGYKELFLLDELGEEEVKNLIKRNTRRYAKRQITWLKNQYDKYQILDKNDIISSFSRIIG